MKEKIRLIQARVGVEADGIIGPRTLEALMMALKIEERPVWPSQAAVRAGKSIFGQPGDESQLVSIRPPYPLFYEGREVKSIRVHEKIAAHVEAALAEVLDTYGLGAIKRLGLDQYSGSYNYRAASGSAALSMHAWGIALDFSEEQNGLKVGAPEASLSRPECRRWWEIWERHGAVSLGRARNYDWMHIQFATL
jgi:hypothetical protein